MITILGVSGFLGSHIYNSLKLQGIHTHGIARRNSDLWRISNFTENVFRLSEAEIESYLMEYRPSTIIDANWEGLRGVARNDCDLQEKNVNRVYRIAELCIEHKVETFITFGSQNEYMPQQTTIPETLVGLGSDEYGKAKALLGKKLEALFLTSDTRFCWARPFSIYGPMDSMETLVANLVKSAFENISYRINSPGTPWSYLYIDDFVNALEIIIGNSEINGVVNIGNPSATYVKEIVSEASWILSRRFPTWPGLEFLDETALTGRIPQVEKLSASNWTPSTPLQIGLEKTVDWFSTQIPRAMERGAKHVAN
jgi:nucleoside-diphosphate-sugar epimerase